MNRSKQSIFLILLCLLAAACGDSRPEISDRKGMNLYGKVKSVTDSMYTTTFSPEGSILRQEAVLVDAETDYIYLTPELYITSDSRWSNYDRHYQVIRSKDTLRVIAKHNEYEEMDREYVFDAQGRVVRYLHFDGMMPIVEEYKYDGEDKHPSAMKYTASYEDGQDIFTCRFSYLEIDKEGNWLQREVNRTWEIVMYNHVDNTEETSTKTDPPFIETRSITYY